MNMKKQIELADSIFNADNQVYDIFRDMRSAYGVTPDGLIEQMEEPYYPTTEAFRKRNQ